MHFPICRPGYIWHQVLDTAEDSMNGLFRSGKERHLDDQKEALVLARTIRYLQDLNARKEKNTKQRSESEPERRNVIC